MTQVPGMLLSLRHALFGAAVVSSLLASTALAGTSAPVHPAGTRTGVAPVDRVLAAVEEGKIARLAGFLQTFEVRCMKNPPGQIPSRPKCKPGEPDGTRVKAFWWATCEGVMVRVEDARATVRAFVERAAGLYAVYRVPKKGMHNPFAPLDGFGVVYADGGGRGEIGMALMLGAGGRIRAIHAGCSENAALFVEQRAGELLLAPLER